MNSTCAQRARLIAIAIVGGAAIAAAARWSPRQTPVAIASPHPWSPPTSPARSTSATADPSPRDFEAVAESASKSLVPPSSPPVVKATKPRRPEPPATLIAPPVVPIEVARAALDAVGDDPDAEAVWAAAINDPALTPHERSDLIEDLNENGFADPDNVSPDELPLVLARLELIEELAPDAMDDVNAAAFAEAYKDLANIADRLTR